MHIAKFALSLLPAVLLSGSMSTQNANVAPGDLKIVTTEQDISSGWRSYFRGPYSKTTIYIHGPRIRHEYIEHRTILYQCDLRRVIHLDLNEKLYSEVDLDGNGFPAGSKYLSPEELDAMLAKEEQAKSAGTLPKPPATVKIVTDSVDTGERKQMYGLTARHVRISRKVIALPGAQTQASESESDGWYVDLTVLTQCPTAYDAIYAKHHVGMQAFLTTVTVSPSGKRSRHDSYALENHGKPETGFPVEVTMTSKDVTHEGSHLSSTFRKSIISLEPLDPALFEVAGDFAPGKISAVTGRVRPDTLFGDIEDWWHGLTWRFTIYSSRAK